LFLTLPIRALTGQQVIASDGYGTRRTAKLGVRKALECSGTGQARLHIVAYSDALEPYG
jgi:hypothetical protein